MEAGFDAIFFTIGVLFLLALFIWSARSRFREIDAGNNELDVSFRRNVWIFKLDPRTKVSR